MKVRLIAEDLSFSREAGHKKRKQRQVTQHFENVVDQVDRRRAQRGAPIQTASPVTSSDGFFGFFFLFFLFSPLVLLLHRSPSLALSLLPPSTAGDLRVLKRMLHIKNLLILSTKETRRTCCSSQLLTVETRANGETKGQNGTGIGRRSNRVSPTKKKKK